jgi:hypothetical protein
LEDFDRRSRERARIFQGLELISAPFAISLHFIAACGGLLVQRHGAKGEAVQTAPRALLNEVHAPKSADINV